MSSSHFRDIQPGFGSRHVADDAPFMLWDPPTFDIRNPTDEECNWLCDRFDANRISFDSTELTITTSTASPQLVPLTIAGCLVRFVPPGVDVSPILSYAKLGFYSTLTRDIFPFPLPRYKFPTLEQRSIIVDTLQREVNMRAVHFLPPFVIVELSVTDGRKYERRTLPENAGGFKIMYYHAERGFWLKPYKPGYAGVSNPTTTMNDNSEVMIAEPPKFSPGVCVSSASNANGTSLISTSAGLLLHRGDEQRLTLSTHGFEHSDKVFNPNPTTGQRIGQICRRLPSHDIALAELDPSTAFDNQCCTDAPLPVQLVDHTAIEAGQWFHCHGAFAGRIDLCARSLTSINPSQDFASGLNTPYKDWPINMHFSVFGLPAGAEMRDSIRGAPLVDHCGRVPGLLRSFDESGRFASVAPMDVLLREGWEVTCD